MKERTSQDSQIIEDFKNLSSPPEKDLLSYKNMGLEQSLPAKTGTGWMSVVVVVIIGFACVALMGLIWIARFGHF